MSHYPEEYEKDSFRQAINYRSQAQAKAYDKMMQEGRAEGIKVGTKCDRNKAPESLNDAVSSPNHYLKLGYECIEIIASSLSKEAFKGYCMGNFLKYRFRMGDKGEMQQDFSKSKEYLMLYDKYSHLCKDIPF
jgi:hypothetical protein